MDKGQLFNYKQDNLHSRQQHSNKQNQQESLDQINKKIKLNLNNDQLVVDSKIPSVTKKKIKIDDNEDYLDPDNYYREMKTTIQKTTQQQQQMFNNMSTKPQENFQQQQQEETVPFKEKFKQYSNLVDCDQDNQIERVQIEQLEETTPWWAKKERCQDQFKKTAIDIDYDPSSLFIPPGEFNKLPSVMKQYWHVKRQHFDKIIFFQIGHLFELFYDDALIGHQILNLQQKNNKMHASITIKQLSSSIEKLVEHGYKVGIVEQVQSKQKEPALAAEDEEEEVKGNDKFNYNQNNSRTSSLKPQQGILDRQLTQIITKGSYNPFMMDQEPEVGNFDIINKQSIAAQKDQGGDGAQQYDYQPKYILAIRMLEQNQQKDQILVQQTNINSFCQFGICLLEISTSTLTMGFIEEVDNTFNLFKTMLWQVRPTEIVIDPKNISQSVLKILHSDQFIKPQITLLHDKNQQWHQINANEILQKTFGEKESQELQGNISIDKWPKALQYFVKSQNEIERNLVFQALSGIFAYLQDLLIQEEVLQAAHFMIYDYQQNILQQCMMLDAQALQNLEILPPAIESAQCYSNFQRSQQDLSLLGFVDRAVTPFGKRMMKHWICAPLLSVDRLNERLDALEDLQNLRKVRDEFQNSFLKKLPDLERVIVRLFKFSIQSQRKPQLRIRTNVSQKLKEFKSFLQQLKKCERQIDEKLRPFVNTFKSRRLQRLISFTDEVVQIQKISSNLTNNAKDNSLNRCDISSISNKSVLSQENCNNNLLISKQGSSSHNEVIQDVFNCDEVLKLDQNEQEEELSFLQSVSNSQKPNGLLPHISEMIENFENLVNWSGPNQEVPIPAKGILLGYDTAAEQVLECKEKLQEYLTSLREELKDPFISFSFQDQKKGLLSYYELEISEKSVNMIKDFSITGKPVSGIVHGQTTQLTNLALALEKAEINEETQLSIFVQNMFNEFYLKQKQWNALILIISELDCLCGLSAVSFQKSDEQNNATMCRPVYFEAEYPGDTFLELRGARHPCICKSGLVDFVPNDIVLGVSEQFEKSSSKVDIDLIEQQPQQDTKIMYNSKHTLILTGPNMGGKSTVLRTVCTNVIMAQLGCYVPAQTCRMSIIDRIFTRMGVSDKMVEGKSTFYLEMEEMGTALEKATHRSLVIIDELGRGTSTFDGVAIAYAVLRHIAEHILCRCIFATHYHLLLDEFRAMPSISFFHMASQIDEQNDKIVFLYKLLPGESQKSFGINVAKVVGIDKQIIADAECKAQQLESNLNDQRQQKYNEKAALEILDLILSENNESPSQELQNSLVTQLQTILEENKF